MPEELKPLRCCRRHGLTGSLSPLQEHLGRFVSSNTAAPYTTLLFILVRAEYN